MSLRQRFEPGVGAAQQVFVEVYRLGPNFPLVFGAVAGVIGAYLVLHPRVLVWVLAFRFIPLRISAAWVLGVWVATQLFMVLVNQTDQVAWWAHIGGVVR